MVALGKVKMQHQFQVLKLSNRVEYMSVTRYSVKGMEEGVNPYSRERRLLPLPQPRSTLSASDL
jgi:hypothetical protein